MKNLVFVIDSDHTPLEPCLPSNARRLLKQDKAAVYTKDPFSIVLQEPHGRPITGAYVLEVTPDLYQPHLAIRQVRLPEGSLVPNGGAIVYRREIARKEDHIVTFDPQVYSSGWIPRKVKQKLKHIARISVVLLSVCPIRNVVFDMSQLCSQICADWQPDSPQAVRFLDSTAEYLAGCFDGLARYSYRQGGRLLFVRTHQKSQWVPSSRPAAAEAEGVQKAAAGQ